MVNEEAAERARSHEEILKILRENIDTLDNTLRKVFQRAIEECKFELKGEIKTLEDFVNDFKTWCVKEMGKFQTSLEDQKLTFENEFFVRD